MKTVPSPYFDSTEMRPPCWDTIECVVAKPRPLPDRLVVKYGSNIRGRKISRDAASVVRMEILT